MTETNATRTRNGVRLGAVALLSCAILFMGCDPDLDVDNPNSPDRSEALATGSDVESLIVSSFNAYHDVAHSDLGGVLSECQFTAWTSTINSMADHTTSNWANYGHDALGSEPRGEVPNSQAATPTCVFATPWFRAYQGLAAASEGLKAIEEGVQIGDEGQDNARARAWAKMSQGLLHGMLSILYDKSFIVDETVQLTDAQGNAIIPEFSSYQEVNSAAVSYLQSAITIASNNDFTIPAGWTNGTSLSSQQFIALAHSYIGRFMARWPRNPTEAQSVAWGDVASHLQQGHTFLFSMPANQGFWSGLDFWTEAGGASQQFSFVDGRTVGPADQSGDYQNWLSLPPSQRSPDSLKVETPDERIPEAIDSLTAPDGSAVSNKYGCEPASLFGEATQEPTGPVAGNPVCGMAPSFIGYHNGTYMPAARGLEGLSHYSRYETYYGPCSLIQQDRTFDGPVCEFTQFDKDMLLAEALWRDGQQQAAADILNGYRDGAGVGDVSADGVSGENCVPRTADGACAGFIQTLAYEKGLLVSAEHTGDMWADKRRWGMLTQGTANQFPVPAQELSTVGEEIYTFGGNVDGDAAPVIQEGNLESILRKVRWSLQVLEAQEQSRERRMPTQTAGAQRTTGVFK